MDIPFSLDRDARASLADQLAENVRMLVRSGRYREGDVLPTLDEFSRHLGVSLIVVRQALRKLSDEGVVKARPRIGTVILPPKARVWKGNVIVVLPERYDNYLVSIVSGILCQSLLKSGYLISNVIVFLDKRGKPDFRLLDTVAAQPTDLAVVLFDRWGMARRISRLGIPLVVVGEGRKSNCRCDDYIRYDSSAAVPEFVAHCRASGVGLVEVVSVGSRIPDVSRPLISAGIGVVARDVEMRRERGIREDVERSVFDYFRRRLGSSSPQLPDVLFFNDDFAARGALTALQGSGIHVPGDVSVVTWSNAGNAPVYSCTLTRMEIDPFEAGEAVANRVLAFLRGGSRVDSTLSLQPRYLIGESFR